MRLTEAPEAQGGASPLGLDTGNASQVPLLGHLTGMCAMDWPRGFHVLWPWVI